MFALERVLAPINLHDGREANAKYAIDAATELGAELTLLHVVNWRQPGNRNLGLNWPECAMTRFDPSCVVHRAVTHGSVPAAVSRYASFVDANLIVLSRQPPSLWQRLRRRRSMIEQIVEAATKPVLVGNLAKGASPLFSVCPRILCMVPLTDDRRGFLTYAQSLAQQTGGELLLLAATPQVNEGLLLEMIAGEPHPLSPELALEQLQSLGASLAVPNRSIVVSGSPYRGLRKVIQKHRIDLVLAPLSKGNAPSTDGLNTGGLLRNVWCPLLSIPSQTAPLEAEVQSRSNFESLEMAGRRA